MMVVAQLNSDGSVAITQFDGEVVPLFQPGDVVKLNSGGPRMTVCRMQGSSVEVRWFDRQGMNETLVAIRAIHKVKDRSHDASV